MTKFSYRSELYLTYNTTTIVKEVEVPLCMTAAKQLADDLPQKGEEGWELTAMVGEGIVGLWAYFKKPQEEQKILGPKARNIVASAKSRPEVKFPTSLPVQRDFPSRDFSTGVTPIQVDCKDASCGRSGCGTCRSSRG